MRQVWVVVRRDRPQAAIDRHDQNNNQQYMSCVPETRQVRGTKIQNAVRNVQQSQQPILGINQIFHGPLPASGLC